MIQVPPGMHKKVPAFILTCTSLAASLSVGAAGFGRVTTSAVMGQPLVMQVPIHLDTGERMTAECVTAEVIAGDSRLPPSQVRVQVLGGRTESDWVARISTTSPIEEPVLEVAISAGCERRFMRRFTAFADPPGMSTGSPAVMAGAGAMSQPVAPTTRAVDDLFLAPVPGTAPKSLRGPRKAIAESPDNLAASKPAKPVASKAPRAQAAAAQRDVVPRETQVARLLLDVGGPRLKMDMEDPIMQVADSVVAAASEAGVGSGNDEFERLRLLEKSLTELRKESQASRDAQLALKGRLADAEAQSRLLPWLLALLAVMSALAVWLALRLRKKARQPDAAAGPWWSSEVAPLDATLGPVPVPPISVAGELTDDEPATAEAAPAGVTRPVSNGNDAAWASASVADDAFKTAPFPGPQSGFNGAASGVLDGAVPAREVSVEELLDLEQQADFFIALGQEDAAVDLLMSHLRSSGGQSPLPYTKLLEIYRRQGDRGAYERIRARFNRRFNAYAPDWDVGPLHGRSLEDYPDVLAHLEAIWPSPIDAMAVLEGMLFRKDESQDLFDLPAYKDVLLMYSLARDLWQQGGYSSTEVDLLLPLGDTGPSTYTKVASEPADPFGSYDLTAFHLDDISTPSNAPAAPSPAAAGASTKGDDLSSMDLDLNIDLHSDLNGPNTRH